jgi:hypothetical protein
MVSDAVVKINSSGRTDVTALSKDVLAPPPKDKVAIEARPEDRADVATKFSPETMSVVEPEPASLSTFTATTFAAFATPHRDPAAVAAVCVPVQKSQSESAELHLGGRGGGQKLTVAVSIRIG